MMSEMWTSATGSADTRQRVAQHDRGVGEAAGIDDDARAVRRARRGSRRAARLRGCSAPPAPRSRARPRSRRRAPRRPAASARRTWPGSRVPEQVQVRSVDEQQAAGGGHARTISAARAARGGQGSGRAITISGPMAPVKVSPVGSKPARRYAAWALGLSRCTSRCSRRSPSPAAHSAAAASSASTAPEPRAGGRTQTPRRTPGDRRRSCRGDPVRPVALMSTDRLPTARRRPRPRTGRRSR